MKLVRLSLNEITLCIFGTLGAKLREIGNLEALSSGSLPSFYCLIQSASHSK